MSRVAWRVVTGVGVASVLGAVVVGVVSARAPVVRIAPLTALEDQPVSIRASGLPSGGRVSVGVRSTDAKGFVWVSSARFRADDRGTLDLGRAPSLGGSYSGVWGMGLIAAMHPTHRDPYGDYFWHTDRPMHFEVTVRVGTRTMARMSFARRWSHGPLPEQSETVASAGFVGDFFASRGAHHKPAVLVLGGSEGGLSTPLIAARFAADGYPALALAYFHAPGLPQTLTNIPLEYFQHAMQWLARQPQVDQQQIVVLGASRGSEPALLLGVHYPDLVHGVIALVPSSVVNCGIAGAGRTTGCIGAAWTVDGKAIPYTQQINQPHPTDIPDAVIPVEQISAPILLACGGQDLTWHSCAYARAITDRINARNAAAAHALYAYPQAGHDIGIALPYEPGALQRDIWAPQDEQAREQLWPHILSFLRSLR